jgi:hypothetical protein
VRFEDVLRGERANLQIWLDAMPAPSGMMRIWPSGWKLKWMASMDDLLQQQIDGIAQEGMRALIGRPLDTQWFPPGPHFSLKDILHSFDSTMKSALEADTRLLMARVALAAARWRLEKGSWPESPAVLTESFPAGLPISPLSGQPLRWAASAEGGFTVKSSGFKPDDKESGIEWKVMLPASAAH